MKMHIKRLILISLFLGFGIVPKVVIAQSLARPDRGTTALVPYDSSGIENINLQNGNVNLKIPLAALPPIAGGKLGFTIYAYYNSKLWDTYIEERHTPPGYMTWYGVSIPRQSAFGGWRIGTVYSVETEMALNDYEFDPGNPSTEPQILQGYHRTFLTTPDGGRHEMRPIGPTPYSGNTPMFFGYVNQSPATTGQPMTYYSTDGSFIRMKVYPPASTLAWEVFLTDGTKIEQAGDNSFQRIIDSNGNKINIFSDGQGTHYQDEYTGREIRVTANPSTGNTDVWYQSTGGNWQKVEVVFGTTNVNGKFYTVSVPDAPYNPACDFHELFNGTLSVVREIIFPQTESEPPKYTFEYNSDTTGGTATYTPACYAATTTYSSTSYGLGELSKMTTPSGSEHEYAYFFDGESIFNGPYVDKNIGANKIMEKVVTHDGVADLWSYSITEFDAFLTNPDGSLTELKNYGHLASVPASNGGQNGLAGLTYRETRSGNVRVERRWSNLTFSGASQLSSGGLLAFNPVVTHEFTSLLNTMGDPTLMSAKTFQYDYNGNVIETKEYDWFDPALVTRDSLGIPIAVPGSAVLLRTTGKSLYNSPLTSGSSDIYALTSNTILNAPKEIAVGSSVTQFSYDGAAYGTSPTNGNVTKTSVWDSAGSQWISTTATYDSRGNITSSTDPNGNVTQLTYGSINGFTGLYPTQTVTAYGTSVARTSSVIYDFYTGLPTSATDVDNGVTNSTEYDIFGRPVKVITADGTALESWTQTTYDDQERRIIVKSDLETKGDGKKVAIQHFDQLGRVRLSRTLENSATEDPTNEQHGIKVETRYKSNGTCTFDASKICSFQITSNPFRAATATAATGEETMGWTLSQSRNDGRYSEIQTFGGAPLPSAFGGSNSNSTGVVKTSSDANATIVTDQAGKLRRSISNALGQLIRIDEPNGSNELGTVTSPNQPTAYTYDTLNNLLTVTQAGSGTEQCGPAGGTCSQTRTFTYSSLSRLLSAANPESGTIAYEYDNNGNLTEKTDARSIVTTYTYDALNRVTLRAYTNEPSGSETADVAYTYDNVTNAKGKLTKVTNGTGANTSTTEYASFDILGRVTRSIQTTDGVTYGGGTDENLWMKYSYNLAGALIEQQYPSGRKVKNVLDNSGDLSIVESKKNSSSGFWHYADSFTYNAAGALTSMQLGNGRWESTVFNSRLQPTQIALGVTQNATNLLDLNYSYGTTANNGNVLSQTITVPGLSQPFVQTYIYDSLNRLSSATETNNSSQTWKQTFVYDRYGNRRFDFTGGNTTVPASSCTEAICNPTISASNNRLTSSGYNYDSSGNATYDAALRKFTYDAENKQIKAESTNSSQVVTGTLGEYVYDGDGRRVKKIVGDEVTIFVYDAAGKLIAEYSTIVASINDAKVAYLTNDHLGSPRINTDANGTVTARHDYHPFGGEIATAQRTSSISYASDSVRKQFTGYDRDKETDLDKTGARMFASHLGRFNSPDPRVFGAVAEPAAWNHYSYALNNPYAYIDSDGAWPTWIHNMIVDRAFPGLSAEEREAIKRGNFEVDSWGDTGLPRTVLPSESYKHSMLSKYYRTIGKMEQARGAFVDSNLRIAMSNPLGDGTPSATANYAFGQARHPHHDGDSPAHSGSNSYYDTPTPLSTALCIVCAAEEFVVGSAVHSWNESSITGSQLNKLVQDERAAYLNTFGQSNYQRATTGTSLPSAWFSSGPYTNPVGSGKGRKKDKRVTGPTCEPIKDDRGRAGQMCGPYIGN